MSLGAAERLREDDGHHPQHGAWPWTGTCYTAVEKEKRKDLTALSTPPQPHSPSPKMCWRPGRQRVSNLVNFKNTQKGSNRGGEERRENESASTSRKYYRPDSRDASP